MKKTIQTEEVTCLKLLAPNHQGVFEAKKKKTAQLKCGGQIRKNYP
jgi:hypothetical protein